MSREQYRSTEVGKFLSKHGCILLDGSLISVRSFLTSLVDSSRIFVLLKLSCFEVFFLWTNISPSQRYFWEMICLFPKVGYVGSLGRSVSNSNPNGKASNCRASELSSLLWWPASGIYANFGRQLQNLRFWGKVQHFDWWQVIQNWPSGYIYRAVRVVQRDKINSTNCRIWVELVVGFWGAVKNPQKNMWLIVGTYEETSKTLRVPSGVSQPPWDMMIWSTTSPWRLRSRARLDLCRWFRWCGQRDARGLRSSAAAQRLQLVATLRCTRGGAQMAR